MIVDLPFVTWGSGSRRALLVHGITSSSRVWWRVASALARNGWTVVAPDLRGHGSAPAADRYPFEEMADDLTALDGPWDVAVGHSMGADILAVGRVEANRMVLVDPVVYVEPKDRTDMLEELVAEAGPQDSDSLAAANPRWHADDVFWKVWSAARVSPTVVRQVFVDNDPWDVRDRLATARVPTTVLRADGGLLAAETLLPIRAANQLIEVVEVHECGHSIHRDHPDVVIGAIAG